MRKKAEVEMESTAIGGSAFDAEADGPLAPSASRSAVSAVGFLKAGICTNNVHNPL